ncbi:MAG: ATP-binding cassette domain-containing protein [Elusimicrobia bacterium]|nr:ATP-binding cassette domain-containing protein [Elusimicrobiota bacterium]
MHFPVHGGILFRRVATVFAVDGVSFDVMPGETVGLVGESGCGKSTLGKAILRLYDPTAGQVLFEGRDLAGVRGKELRSLRRDLGIIFQDPYESLNQTHPIGFILQEPFLIHGVGTPESRRAWARELLAKVGLPPSAFDRYPHEFSGGQRQRIGIARAIALKPKLVILDEPVSALDVSIQSQILNLLLDLQREMGLAYVFIAHDLAVVKHVSDRIAVMYLGKVVETAPADELHARPLHPYTQALMASIPEPDPSRRIEDKPVLEGDVPSPRNPPPGCRFHTRCPFAQARCREEEPILRPGPGAAAGHQVACHYAGELVPKEGR